MASFLVRSFYWCFDRGSHRLCKLLQLLSLEEDGWLEAMSFGCLSECLFEIGSESSHYVRSCAGSRSLSLALISCDCVQFWSHLIFPALSCSVGTAWCPSLALWKAGCSWPWYPWGFPLSWPAFEKAWLISGWTKSAYLWQLSLPKVCEWSSISCTKSSYSCDYCPFDWPYSSRPYWERQLPWKWVPRSGTTYWSCWKEADPSCQSYPYTSLSTYPLQNLNRSDIWQSPIPYFPHTSAEINSF